MKKENEFNTLIYVELPNLVNRIMKNFCMEDIKTNELIANEIKKSCKCRDRVSNHNFQEVMLLRILES